jgi:hypothetical protein
VVEASGAGRRQSSDFEVTEIDEVRTMYVVGSSADSNLSLAVPGAAGTSLFEGASPVQVFPLRVINSAEAQRRSEIGYRW